MLSAPSAKRQAHLPIAHNLSPLAHCLSFIVHGLSPIAFGPLPIANKRFFVTFCKFKEVLMSDSLKTGIQNARNVTNYLYRSGAIEELGDILDSRRNQHDGPVIFFFDHFFQKYGLPEKLPTLRTKDLKIYVDTTEEPKTTQVNKLLDHVKTRIDGLPCAIVGIGGGATMDVAKAVSNLLMNPGQAEDYQGWDLVKMPGVYKIGIPTISGTGAESTRTCVMTNPENGLKLGMNSDYTVYDQIILDPDLTSTVPRNQYFLTGMDAYIHCMESLSGSYRNAIGDAFSNQSILLCREVFSSPDMMSDDNRAKLMVASYLGGCAIATSYVGVVHPFSAGLSVVLGIHHCVGNCIVMRAMEEFYPDYYSEFWEMANRQDVRIPEGICRNLTETQYDCLYEATIIHEKPLTNALGEDFRKILTRKKVESIFRRM